MVMRIEDNSLFCNSLMIIYKTGIRLGEVWCNRKHVNLENTKGSSLLWSQVVNSAHAFNLPGTFPYLLFKKRTCQHMFFSFVLELAFWKKKKKNPNQIWFFPLISTSCNFDCCQFVVNIYCFFHTLWILPQALTIKLCTVDCWAQGNCGL